MANSDGRHYNRKYERNLNTEMDLWLLFKQNNEQPLVIGTAVSKGKINDAIFTLYYSPVDYAKSIPFLVTYDCGAEHDSCRFETISSAKYYVKKSDNTAKWQRKK